MTTRTDEIEDIEAQLLEGIDESPWYAIQAVVSTDASEMMMPACA